MFIMQQTCQNRNRMGGGCSTWFHYKCEGTTEERIRTRNTTSAKKTRNISNQKSQLESSENSYNRKKRTEVEAKYKNLQKIHESTKKQNKIYQTEIQKLKHEKDTAKEVTKPLRNGNFKQNTNQFSDR